MDRISKTFALCLTLIIAMSCLTLLMIVKPANAQTGVTQPVVPRFDVFLNTQPYEIPPTYGVDPSTGKAVMTQAGYEVIYKWVSVRVYGQPFWEYNNSAGQRVLLYYNVRWQSNLDTVWQTFPNEVKYFHDSMDPWDTQGDGYLISIGFKGIDNATVGMPLLDPNVTEIGLQVEALIGYYNSNNVFVGQSSGWSNTQTVSIPTNVPLSSTSPNPTQSSTPNVTPTSTPTTITTVPDANAATVPLSVFIAVVAVLAAVIASLGLLLYRRHRDTTKNPY